MTTKVIPFMLVSLAVGVPPSLLFERVRRRQSGCRNLAFAAQLLC
jgi:hypothetical protein